MTADDLTQIADIERESFPEMWPLTVYKRELANKIARYLILSEVRDDPPHEAAAAPGPPGLWGAFRRMVGTEPALPGSEYLLGFVGVWLMVGEAHIVTVAVREAYRRIGIGERLLIAATEMSRDYDQEVLTLEVRASNEVAQRLYEKYGFLRMGVRKRYYTDNNEDAVIMTTPTLTSGGYRAHFERLREEHRAGHPDLWS